MTNYKKIFAVILFLSAAVLFTSCKKDDNPVSANGDELVGTWVLTKVIVTSFGNMELTPAQVGTMVTFNINSDRTFKATVVDSSGTEIQTGTWSVANGKISMKSTDGETEEMAYTVSGNKFTVETVYTIDPFGNVPVKLEFTKQ